jgi:hypothetical protein
LPLSLEKLIEGFSIETKKLPFPYKFITEDKVKSNYIGEIPNYSDYYKHFNLENYNKYIEISDSFKDKQWDLTEETKNYLYNDIKSLYEVIDKFSKEIYSIERYNITDAVTISSLSLNIFLTNYYNQNKTPIHIPRINQYKEIKSAYFGGRVEIYKTYGEDLYIYDVNSLYPYVMLKDMPVGNIIKSSDTNLDNYFGFCYAAVNVPSHVKNPVLSYRDDLGNVYNPTGNWTGMFSSEILKLARDVDKAEISIKYGYKFDRGKDVFKKYVEKYFNLKKEASIEKNNAKRTLAKLLLNSLYGRFGLKYHGSKTDIVTSERAKELTLKYKILDNIVIDEENEVEIIKYTSEPSDVLKDIDKKGYFDLISKTEYSSEDFINRSLPISAMITSYAACFMNKFLNLPDNECYYSDSDTDSVVLKKPLSPEYVGNSLGQFKFVGKAKKAYFISPKTYCLVLENGEKIIKSKGIDNLNLNENNFIDMLYSLNIKTTNNFKFKRDFNNFTINYKEYDFTVSPKITKREPIYENYKIIDTKPLYVNNGILITKNAIKFNFGVVHYNSNKYALIPFINLKNKIVLYKNSNKNALIPFIKFKNKIVLYKNSNI